MCADDSWDEVDANVVCRQLGLSYQPPLSTSNGRFGVGEGPVLLERITCSQSSTNISQCVDFRFTGTSHDCKLTAEVICTDEDIMMNTPAEQVTTTVSPHDTTSTSSAGSGSLMLPIFTSLGALMIIGVIAAVAIVIIMVVVIRKRAGRTKNRYTQQVITNLNRSYNAFIKELVLKVCVACLLINYSWCVHKHVLDHPCVGLNSGIQS